MSATRSANDECAFSSPLGDQGEREASETEAYLRHASRTPTPMREIKIIYARGLLLIFGMVLLIIAPKKSEAFAY